MARKLVSDECPYLYIGLTVDLPNGTLADDRTLALFDSGFSGDVSIPAELIQNGHRPTPDLYADLTLADRSKAKVAVFEGSVRFDQIQPEPINVTVLVLGDEVIVGRSLMNHFKVTLDHGRTLTVEP